MYASALCAGEGNDTMPLSRGVDAKSRTACYTMKPVSHWLWHTFWVGEEALIAQSCWPNIFW